VESDLLKNVFLSLGTARSIDQCVQKVLADLGNPEPPLKLDIVRDMLELDKEYYSSTDQGILQDTVHKLRMAGKQVLKRPTLILDAIKKFDLNALWLPDRKRILLDSNMPVLKQRWGEIHEISHSIIPWHEPLVHGDQRMTLTHTCKEQVEAEANYAAGRLLFFQERFVEEVRSSEVCLNNVQKWGKAYGNTITSTLWRTVESLIVPAFGLVSIHPQGVPDPDSHPVRRFIRSESFADRFSAVTAMQVFEVLGTFCYGVRGPIGSDHILITDINNVKYVFAVESFYNSYDALTIGILQKVHAASAAVE
jgi:hypothetical protein